MKGLLEKLGVKQPRRPEFEPLCLSHPVRFPYGPFQFRIKALKGVPYTVEASSNLKAWTSIASGQAKGETDFIDSDASNFSYRFYRVNSGGVWSRNVIGYVTLTLVPGFSAVTNPMRSDDSRVSELFKTMPEGTTVSRFDPRLHELTENTFKRGKWTNPAQNLATGEGAMVFNPGSDYKSLSFVGDVVLGNFCTPVPAGFSLRGSSVPQPGRLDTELGFPVGEGDVLHLFDREKQSYVLCSFQQGVWSPHPPLVGVGEAFWVAKKEARNWIGTISSSVAVRPGNLSMNQ